MLFRSREISDQDATLASFAIDQGRAMVVVVNKWDGLDPEQRERIKQDIDRKLIFLQFAELLYISALHGTAVGNIFPAVERAYQAAMKDLPTSFLTRILEKAVEKTPPPMNSGRRMKPKFAHQGGHNPPVIVIHGNQLDKLPGSYRRYLVNAFRKKAALQGTPIRLEMKSAANPFEGRPTGMKKTLRKKH